MYYSAIGILAVLILLIENHDILLNRHGAFELPAWKVYRRFLLAVLVYYVTDIVWGIAEASKMPLTLFIDTSVYFIAMAAGILFWTQYAVSYLEEDTAFGRFLINAGRVFAGLVVLATVINTIAPVLFTVDADSVYSARVTRYVILSSQILLFVLVSIYTFSSIIRRNATGKKRNRCRTLGLFGLIMALFLYIQVWYPYLPLYSAAYMVGTCVLHTFVVWDEKEEYRFRAQEGEKIAALKQSLTSLLDNMPGMTFTKDAETGVYLACNQAFADYSHKESPEGVTGLSADQIFDAETAAHFTEDDKIALSMDVPYIYFEDVPDAAGNRRQLQTTKLKYIDSAGRLCVLGILDVNDLKKINDTEGHAAGDQYIRDACKLICNIFKRSPVFRIGGDEFAVISQGSDYERIEELTATVGRHNEEARRTGGIVIACGMAKYENDDSVAPVFERADQNMYENKAWLKEDR